MKQLSDNEYMHLPSALIALESLIEGIEMMGQDYITVDQLRSAIGIVKLRFGAFSVEEFE